MNESMNQSMSEGLCGGMNQRWIESIDVSLVMKKQRNKRKRLDYSRLHPMHMDSHQHN